MGVPVGNNASINHTCELINELRKIRIEKGISITTLAVDIDVSETQLAAWERGDRDPLFLTCERWARALGYELDLMLISEKESTQ